MTLQPTRPWRALIALVLFGVSFGYVEAAIVVYLRDLYDPLALELDSDRVPGDIFPLITLAQLEAAGEPYLARLKTEVLREAATMVMLAAVGLAVGFNFHTFFAAFLVAFGIWDIFYYVFLKLLIDWPASLWDWDILFLIPVPWVGPVLAPVLVAISMIAVGVHLLWRESAGRSVRIGWQHWSLGVLGGLIIVISFCWDYRYVMTGGMPSSFPWSIWLAGEAIGLSGFLLAVRYSARR